ncbi:UDP-3-O-acyl-N-acetylglucosamine deacetylase [Nodosilinea sp. LEGE 07088]|uniref:UDP-3-O-acyl-N-acetylglucosamine deacetylase n=1 Tax=Nodosilinea sp. LEGE 07088 TaxID=2777968 RepID=UPI001881596B|nr:UDP-3-O-acyl-N-acetylglucosamine deacetylase [Nodosilinea sp. LEGE 07088]MBE9137713.1 UDP-3-O-acyl-N-acetylglucosamine deacetylase [Nodosilinea sp. LEGE 07088]
MVQVNIERDTLAAWAFTEAQTTLATTVERAGVGLHSGMTTHVTLRSAEPGQGRYFVRTDLPGQPVVLANLEAINPTMLSTELRQGEASVRTVEHLLAALAGLGIDNVRIEISGPEVPLLDGSALGWVDALRRAGRHSQPVPRTLARIDRPVSVHRGDAFVAAFPASSWRFTYGIDFEVAAIGNQWFSWSPDRNPFGPEGFANVVAPARTFGLAHQVEQLQANGLIRGGSLDNALVCSQAGWLNPPLRFDNEPARHKMLDLIGDLSLLGTLPVAHVVAYKASHSLHGELAKALASALIYGEGTL